MIVCKPGIKRVVPWKKVKNAKRQASEMFDTNEEVVNFRCNVNKATQELGNN